MHRKGQKCGVSAIITDTTNRPNEKEAPTNNIEDTMPKEAQGIGAIMSQHHNKVQEMD